MAILIKGMEMPESCYWCQFADGSWSHSPPHQKRCMVTGKDMPVDKDGYQSNQPCPLISVPEPHGRLIDADELLSQYKGNIWTAQTDYAEGLRDVANDIKQAPTVIEAEEGET